MGVGLGSWRRWEGAALEKVKRAKVASSPTRPTPPTHSHPTTHLYLDQIGTIEFCEIGETCLKKSVRQKHFFVKVKSRLQVPVPSPAGSVERPNQTGAFIPEATSGSLGGWEVSIGPFISPKICSKTCFQRRLSSVWGWGGLFEEIHVWIHE